MELIFKRSDYSPSKEFWGELSKKQFAEEFGTSTRFIARLVFREADTPFEAVYKFIIDTGAFISFAPDVILDCLKIKPEFTGFIRGATPQDKCRVQLKVAKIPFQIIDDENRESHEMNGWFGFHSTLPGRFQVDSTPRSHDSQPDYQKMKVLQGFFNISQAIG